MLLDVIGSVILLLKSQNLDPVISGGWLMFKTNGKGLRLQNLREISRETVVCVFHYFACFTIKAACDDSFTGTIFGPFGRILQCRFFSGIRRWANV